MSISDILRKAGGMQSPYTAYSPVSWYNREESHSGQLYHLYKAVLSLCPEYDTSLRYYTMEIYRFQDYFRFCAHVLHLKIRLIKSEINP